MLAALALERVGPDATAGALRTAVVAVSREGPAYGPQDVDEVFRALRAGREASYQGASGDVDLQDDGSVTARFALWRVRDGGLVETPLAP